MILYVLAVWFCAVGCVVLIELFVLSLPQPARTTLQTLDSNLPGMSGQPPEQGSALILGLALLLVGLILGYILEWRLGPIQGLYRRLQKAYPPWYSRLPAQQRELWISAGLSTLLLVFGLLPGLLNPALLLVALPLAAGLGLGLSLPPLLRFRRTLTEDRPETPPQAVLHKVVPDYSLERALRIGQIYLRLLLPVFALFCMLALPLALAQHQPGPGEILLLLVGLFGGAGLGWLSHRESQLDFEAFRRNVYQLCSLSLLAAAFVIFGLSSGNLAELLLMSAFGGYLVGLY
ncbi:MAG: hypothetical protein ACAI44_15395 [Candidatus Sericytochromatia bacterium]